MFRPLSAIFREAVDKVKIVVANYVVDVQLYFKIYMLKSLKIVKKQHRLLVNRLIPY